MCNPPRSSTSNPVAGPNKTARPSGVNLQKSLGAACSGHVVGAICSTGAPSARTRFSSAATNHGATTCSSSEALTVARRPWRGEAPAGRAAHDVDVQPGMDVDVEDPAAPEPRLQLPEVRPCRHPPSESQDRPRARLRQVAGRAGASSSGRVLEHRQRVIGQFYPGAERAFRRVELQPQVGRRPTFDVEGEAAVRGNGPAQKGAARRSGRGPLARPPVAVVGAQPARIAREPACAKPRT